MTQPIPRLPRANTSARRALESTIAASSELQSPVHSAVVDLALRLADQVDAEGSGMSTRLSAAYLSALKDLRRIVTTSPTRDEKPAGRLASIKAATAKSMEGPKS